MPNPKDGRLKRLRELRRKDLRIARRAKRRAKMKEGTRRKKALQVAERRYRSARGRLWKIRHRRKRLAELRARPKEAKAEDFFPWMLNGCPGNIHWTVKIEVVRAIRHGLVITATTNGTHTPSSRHYPWNSPDHLGHAIDAAGPWDKMQRFTADSFAEAQHFNEFFGPPNNRFVKHGAIYAGSIPNHYNHNHDSPNE